MLEGPPVFVQLPVEPPSVTVYECIGQHCGPKGEPQWLALETEMAGDQNVTFKKADCLNNCAKAPAAGVTMADPTAREPVLFSRVGRHFRGTPVQKVAEGVRLYQRQGRTDLSA